MAIGKIEHLIICLPFWPGYKTRLYCFCSVHLRGNIFVVYVIEFVVQVVGSCGYYSVEFCTSLYFIGMCFYIKTMETDLRARIVDLNMKYLQARAGVSYTPMENLHAYANEIRFHNEIIEYGRDFP